MAIEKVVLAASLPEHLKPRLAQGSYNLLAG